MKHHNMTWAHYTAQVLCDDGEEIEIYFSAAPGDDLIARSLQEARERGYIAVECIAMEETK